MKNTWFVSLLIITLAVLGVSLDTSSIANQEIVLKFNNLDVPESESEQVIDFVKSQLRNIAVSNIKISKGEHGVLKITYHSDLDTTIIKETLSKEVALMVENDSSSSDKELPFSNEENLANYELDVFEIQPAKDYIGATGIVVEIKNEIIRFFTPDAFPVLETLEEKHNSIAKVLCTTYGTKTLEIQVGFCDIPEARAGPKTT